MAAASTKSSRAASTKRSPLNEERASVSDAVFMLDQQTQSSRAASTKKEAHRSELLE